LFSRRNLQIESWSGWVSATANNHIHFGSQSSHFIGLESSLSNNHCFRPLQLVSKLIHQFRVGDWIHRNPYNFRALIRHQSIKHTSHILHLFDWTLSGNTEPNLFTRLPNNRLHVVLETRHLYCFGLNFYSGIRANRNRPFRRSDQHLHRFQARRVSQYNFIGALNSFAHLRRSDFPLTRLIARNQIDHPKTCCLDRRKQFVPNSGQQRIQIGVQLRIHTCAENRCSLTTFRGSREQLQWDLWIVGQTRRSRPYKHVDGLQSRKHFVTAESGRIKTEQRSRLH
jgi:hypothetical protein